MRRRVFAAARYGPNSALVFEAIAEALKAASASLGIDAVLVRPDQMPIGAKIVDTIREQIQQADLIIADVSGGSPNVMWETGFAQASGKPVLLLSEDVGHVPFDLRDHRILLYQRSAPISNLVLRLTDALVGMLHDSAPKKARPSPQARPSPRRPRRRRRVFLSYSHADQEFLHRILVHLRPLERDGLIDLWSDTNIKAGDRWRDEIRKALSDARIAVMLISADFLASDFIVTNELPPLLVAAEERGTRIMPLIVKPSRFARDDRLARFQALNDPKTPVIRMNEAEREDLYAKLAESVELELGAESDKGFEQRPNKALHRARQKAARR
jgi:hypothetical protein